MPEMVCKETKNKTGLYSNIFMLLFFRKAVLGEIPVDLAPNILPASGNEIALQLPHWEL